MALSQKRSSQMTCALMALQPAISGSPDAMNVVAGATIEQRISQPDEERGRCKGSRASDPRKDFSQYMQPHKILSTSNAISFQRARTEPSEHRPCRHGAMPSLRSDFSRRGEILRASPVNVTTPSAVV